jgi:biopolymer transport protein ExbD
MPTIQHQATHRGTGRRGRQRKRVGTALSEINVVPLVDVMLVLLIIFMVAAPMMQRGLDVRLPESRRSDQISSERIFVTIPMSFRTDQVLQIDDESVRFDVLQELMRQTLENQTGRDVFVRGDGGITYQELIQVMDELKAGGVESVGLITDLPATP